MVSEYVAMLAPIGVALGRAGFGWLVNSLKDGEIQSAEWLKLGRNVAVIVGASLFIAAGTPYEFTETAWTLAGLDVVVSELKVVVPKMLGKK